MKNKKRNGLVVATLSLLLVSVTSMANTTVQFGRITAARAVDVTNEGSVAAGALVGGTLGVISGSGQSRSNRALRGVAGTAVGSRMGAAAGSSTAFEYTVLLGDRTTIIRTDQSNLRVGDCVSVERGALNNIRLEADERCASPRVAATDADIQNAYACDAAKRQLIEATTDADFDRAERRVRLLCN